MTELPNQAVQYAKKKSGGAIIAVSLLLIGAGVAVWYFVSSEKDWEKKVDDETDSSDSTTETTNQTTQTTQSQRKPASSGTGCDSKYFRDEPVKEMAFAKEDNLYKCGSSVVAFQKKLVGLGFLKNKDVDGKYGSGTWKAHQDYMNQYLQPTVNATGSGGRSSQNAIASYLASLT
jgi:hypothetical protein